MSLTTQTGCVMLLGLPPSALGGIDLLSFTTTPRFQGIKNVPSGLHFVFAASDSSLAVRHGAWFYLSPTSGPQQLLIKKWNPHNEDLIAETSQAEVLRWRANLSNIWKEGLTPYRQTASTVDDGEVDTALEESTDWSQLTSRITPTLLSRIVGHTPDHWSLTSTSSADRDLEVIPGLDSNSSFTHPEKALSFLDVDLKRTWKEGATGRERTEAAQDRSWALGELIEKTREGGNTQDCEYGLLGEVQFCFIMVLTLNNNSCLEQWKRLLTLLLTCRRAISERSGLFFETLKVLRLQLSRCADMEADMFDLRDYDGGFLKPLLRRFRQGLDDLDGDHPSDIVEEFEDLQDFLGRTFGWKLDDSYVKHGLLELEDGERVEMDVQGADEEDETGEYAPVVVELTSAQMRAFSDTIDSAEEEEDVEDMDPRY